MCISNNSGDEFMTLSLRVTYSPQAIIKMSHIQVLKTCTFLLLKIHCEKNRQIDECKQITNKCTNFDRRKLEHHLIDTNLS